MAYASITVEGGLFPQDLLERIATGDLAGQRPADFGLVASARLTDAVQTAFSDARVYFDAFQRRLAHGRESRTTLTREDWIIPLLRDLLGFEKLAFQRSAAEIDGQSYFVSHRAGSDEQAPPVHIVSIEHSLDDRVEGRRRSPHAMVQELLNRSEALWGIVTNGSVLRLLRDSARLSRPTYLQFDLETIVEQNLYSEFVLLYRLLHSTRFPVDGSNANECLLEQYYQRGLDEGGRVRDKLRDGVEVALGTLGSAFLAHPDSTILREKLARGVLNEGDYYRQLLRLVYRLLFLMVAEERKLLFPDGADPKRQAVYTRYYAVARLRDRADRHFVGDRNSDLWASLRETFRLFGGDAHARQLGLAALDGELFGPEACPDLEAASCVNEALLGAIHRLSTFEESEGRRRAGIRRRVNYAHLDVEEFGSVYESLLDFHPRVTIPSAHAKPVEGPERIEASEPIEGPTFALVAGSERKQTGSYYTPPELVRELVESALVPVMEERLAAAKTTDAKIEALLALRVCDPASGSGHFLLAAARRIARDLAKRRGGEDEPSPRAYREALREVIRQCVYAVDRNPLAVDLCKVALWLEGHTPGMPLSFLDHHVKCGDSLVGVFDLDVLTEGVPDAAYTPVTGDDKAIARAVKARNKEERAGQLRQASLNLDAETHRLAEGLGLFAAPDKSAADVHAKETLYAEWRGGDTWRLRQACNTWTAAFFALLVAGGADTGLEGLIPTTATVRNLLADRAVHGRLAGEIQRIADGQRFFHWPLEFPDVLERGGFDVVLGNPPFMGGRKLTESVGERTPKFLLGAFPGSHGGADLCAYFFRRSYDLLVRTGTLGLVATNTIGQGDTRTSGLAHVVSADGRITHARRFVRWSGIASVEVNLIAIHKGNWDGAVRLDDDDVSWISSRLDAAPEAELSRLRENGGLAFQGSIVLGKGFILDEREAMRLLSRDERNRDCLFPYLTGEDVNSRPDHSPSRWVINLGERDENQARTYPLLWEILQDRVRPERVTKDARKYPRMVYEWWKHWNNRRELYEATRDLKQVLVRSRVSDMHMLAFVPTGYVYSDATVVFAFDDFFHFAILQSSVHEAWVQRNASTMRTDVRYTPTDCFETFAFPLAKAEEEAQIAACGRRLYDERANAMRSRGLGLTKLQHLVNEPTCEDSDILTLRALRAEMDRAVLASYGWHDVDLALGFHSNDRAQMRFSPSALSREVLFRRLTELNHHRAGVGPRSRVR